MAERNDLGLGQYSPRELAYLEYVNSQATLAETESTVDALETELSELEVVASAARRIKEETDQAFRNSLAATSDAIINDETLEPLERFIWGTSFRWASKEKSVDADTDLLAFTTDFQNRVESIQSRIVKGAPIISVDWRSDNSVLAGTLTGDRLLVDENSIKTPALENGVTAWGGWGHSGDWKRFSPRSVSYATLFHASWLKGSDPLSDNPGEGLDRLRGWDDQPGFAREQTIFIGEDEIKGFLNNDGKKIKTRFHGLLAAGVAGVKIANLEEELPEDLVLYRDNIAEKIAKVIAFNILDDAVSESSDDALRKSARKHVERFELPPLSEMETYLKAIGIDSDRLLGLVVTQLEKLEEDDFAIGFIAPQVLPAEEVADRVNGFFQDKSE